MKFQKQDYAPEQIKKSLTRREESNSGCTNTRPVFSSKMVSEGQEDFGTMMLPSLSGEQVQRVRQSKGNQELNDELKMKVDELEKLFADHKLRFPGEQSSSAWRNKPADTQIVEQLSLPSREPAEMAPAQLLEKSSWTETLRGSRNMSKSSVNPPLKILDNPNYDDSLKQNFSDLDTSADSRGKLYERYVQKRDAKLREEWGSKRSEKEAKMKVMQDCFEQSRAEMQVKFSGTADRRDSAPTARRRAERLRPFTTPSTRNREQHPTDLLQCEDEVDLLEFTEQLPYGHDNCFGEISLGSSGCNSNQLKKLSPLKKSSSFTPHTSAVLVPKSSVKSSKFTLGRRRMQPENPLMQSVPNFSDLKKENTKPSSGVSKITTRAHARNHARGKSISGEIPLVKEEKTCRLQSTKSSASLADWKDLSSPDTEGVVLTSFRFDKEQTENPFDKFLKSMESIASEFMNDEEESYELAFNPEESMDAVKEEEEVSEVMNLEDHVSRDNGKPRLSQEDKLVNSGSESCDGLGSFSQVDPSFAAELPAAVCSTFHPVGSVQDSPAESPVSWNPRLKDAFSCSHETFDINASDSPMGSPAYWNSHSLNQEEVDAATMRKKRGSAQEPSLVSDSSRPHSRKDATDGFKRLLKFGRKICGTEFLVDWISATTSEGDYVTEDGRDPSNRSSEDLRKSRMRLSQGHPSADSFNESAFSSEQVEAVHSSIPEPPSNFKLRADHLSGSSIKAPRSFFSLSYFRSKGNGKHSKA